MATAVKRKASESTNGKSTLVVATASPGTLIHTAVAGTTPGTFDETFIAAYNGHTAAVTLCIEEGSGDALPMTITLNSKEGWIPIEMGFILQNGIEIRAYASVTNVVKLRTYVNAITD